MRILTTTLLLLLFQVALAAGTETPRDRSYTLESAFAKISKHYPEATLPWIDELCFRWDDLPYRRIGERTLVADLYETGKDCAPGIVLVHGGGWISGDKSMMQALAKQLVIAGYNVMVPEYRLSPEAPYPAAVGDLKIALSWMRDQEHVDKDRIAIIGCSAGGQLAALVGTKNPELVRAIVDIDGVLMFHHPDSSEGKLAAQWLGGTYEEAPDVWEAASPLNHVSRQTPPTLFIASKYPRFLAGHREYMQLLQSQGTRTEKIEMPDAPHSFWLFEPWHTPTMNHIVRFLDDVLR